ncbi:MAG: hypothetical protein AB2693_29765 [Candidatus Thiodiazotropha sp.]
MGTDRSQGEKDLENTGVIKHFPAISLQQLLDNVTFVGERVVLRNERGAINQFWALSA